MARHGDFGSKSPQTFCRKDAPRWSADARSLPSCLDRSRVSIRGARCGKVRWLSGKFTEGNRASRGTWRERLGDSRHVSRGRHPSSEVAWRQIHAARPRCWRRFGIGRADEQPVAPANRARMGESGGSAFARECARRFHRSIGRADADDRPHRWPARREKTASFRQGRLRAAATASAVSGGRGGGSDNGRSVNVA
jgi:hypothetical protein